VNIQIGFPEFCLTCATILMALGIVAPFWFLSIISILGAIARTALHVQEKKDIAAVQSDNASNTSRVLSELFDLICKIPIPQTKKDYTTH